ncbi:MAG: hypothetical protein D6732_15670 [Methanobacteriota archaeon]|nr:MAG: hypothetical protein D6732_15670 [Euryarchaeota archaeon]
METREILRWIWKKSKEDVLVVAFTLLFMATISYFSTLTFGWLKLIVPMPNVSGSPAAQRWLSTAQDTDNDQLPDLMEATPKGEPVVVNGVRVGYGTGTNPFDPDSDNDLFPDNAEVKLGSNPHSWLDPGWVWIAWLLFIGGVVFKLYIHKPDRLKEYRINEEMISRGVAGKGGKYAYGGTSIFGKPISEMTEDEKREFLSKDERIIELTGLPDDEIEVPEPVGLKGVLLRFAIVASVVIILNLLV